MLAAILHALRRAAQRDLGTFAGVKVNNFFLFVALLIAGAVSSGVQPWSAYPFLALMGFLLAFPLSGDPLDKIPVERQLLWPLKPSQRLALRMVGLLLSPMVWLAIALLPKVGRTGAAVLLGFQLATLAVRKLLARLPRLDVARTVPLFPGKLGPLVTSHFRQMLTLLDTWLAIAIAVGAWVYALAASPADPEGPPILGILIALALSTQAQALLDFDRHSGTTLPLQGWEILVAKDTAHLGLLLVLTLALHPAAALAASLTALALGHHSSVFLKLPQKRWRFAGGRLLPVGALQALGTVAAGFGTLRHGWPVLAATALFFLASLYFYGRRLDQTPKR